MIHDLFLTRADKNVTHKPRHQSKLSYHDIEQTANENILPKLVQFKQPWSTSHLKSVKFNLF